MHPASLGWQPWGDMSDSFGQDLVALLPRLRRFAISLCGSAQRADDIVQSACAKALAARQSFQPGTRFDAWMFRIVRNCWIDDLRKSKPDRSHVQAEDAGMELATDGEAAVLSKLTLAKVMQTLDDLPRDQREVLVLVCVEDFSYADAADLLGVPIGTVMSRLARARSKIISKMGIENKGCR